MYILTFTSSVTGQMQNRTDAGQFRCKTGWMQDWTDAGQDRYRKEGYVVHDRTDAGQIRTD